MNTIARNNRSSNLELLRIIAMYLIVSGHSIAGVADLVTTDNGFLNSVFQYMFSWGGKTGINIFMLISGYFMCTSTISLKKFLRLLLHIYFYTIIIGVLFIIFGTVPIDLDYVINMLFPFRTNDIHNFCTCFLWFYLAIPFVNILIENLSKEMHKRLLGLAMICYVGYQFIPTFSVQMDPIMWFSILYFIASYIRKYVDTQKYHKVFGISLLFLLLINYAYIALKVSTGHYGMAFICDANAPLSLGIALCAFCWFKDLHISYNSSINAIGGATFGILLIHANSSAMRDFIWKDLLRLPELYASSYYPLLCIVCVSILYIVCAGIEIIRKRTIEEPILNYVYSVVISIKSIIKL